VPTAERGSLTKEPPLSRIDAAIRLIRPEMTLDALRTVVRQNSRNQPRERAPHTDAPGLLRNRFLLVDHQDRIIYDRFLSLVEAHGVEAGIVRRVMYFVWAWRDDRIRRFVKEVIADRTGKWRAAPIIDLRQAAFFSQFGLPSSAQKIRSNYQFFLTEAGILSNSQVNLDPSEGWLAEAMVVAAQHEPDPALRAAMVRSPVETLFGLDLNSLANLTASNRTTAMAQRIADFVQAEQDTVLRTDATATPIRPWLDRPPPSPSAGIIATTLDLVALERANASHRLLERLFANLLSAAGYTPQASESIDLLAEIAGHTLICEMKSCNTNNFHSQVRRGVSQLLEYRFLYREKLRGETVLALVVETTLPRRLQWLRDYLISLGITLVWKEHGTDRLVSTGAVRPPLDRLITVLP